MPGLGRRQGRGRRPALGTALALLPAAGCVRKEGSDAPSVASAPAPVVVTADIQAGIERHIEEQARMGGGYFHLLFKDRELQLKLVRVHTESGL